MDKSIDVMALHWFAYLGGNIFSNGSYLRIFGEEPINCLGGCVICAIKLDDDSFGSPSDVSSVQDYLGNAIAYQVNQPDLLNPYVRMKNC